jgi:hypothetical protein
MLESGDNHIKKKDLQLQQQQVEQQQQQQSSNCIKHSFTGLRPLIDIHSYWPQPAPYRYADTHLVQYETYQILFFLLSPKTPYLELSEGGGGRGGSGSFFNIIQYIIV